MFPHEEWDTRFMMLGSDVSSLTTTAANAAAQGLSIVVPVYNEAAGLGALHERLGSLARRLRERFRLGCEVVYVDDGINDIGRSDSGSRSSLLDQAELDRQQDAEQDAMDDFGSDDDSDYA